jgi:hypothetical protein
MPDGQMRPAERPPILWIALGRQRVGKTVLLNTAVQYFRGLGNPLRVWNADQQNRSQTLSLFFPDAEEVTGSGIEDGMAWTEARILHQIAHGYDAVLDVGGGATGFEEAMNGYAKDDRGPLSLFDRARVNRWWSRDVPQFFGTLPPEWLPLPRERNVSRPPPSSAGEVA